MTAPDAATRSPGRAGARLRAAGGGRHAAPSSLADYRGRSPLFLALFIGLWCPFCRRADRADRQRTKAS